MSFFLPNPSTTLNNTSALNTKNTTYKRVIKKGFTKGSTKSTDITASTGTGSYAEATSINTLLNRGLNGTPSGTFIPDFVGPKATTEETAGPGAGPTPGVVIPSDYKFNLPPHQWSVPLRPRETTNKYVPKKGALDDLQATYYKSPVTGNTVELYQVQNGNLADTQETFHGLRRGRMWYYLDNELGSYINAGKTVAEAKAAVWADAKKAGKLPNSDTKWGFQFMWNPTEIATSVNINMDVTPSAADRFRAMTGVFPGQESITINVMLDRTNDFACAKGSSITNADNYAKYYLNRYPMEGKQSFSEQFDALMRLGTMADLEYLYRTVNGTGFSGSQWTNMLGKQTADIGFIQPSLIALQLGPNKDSLSYVGWLNSISVNHSSFTETMIPLRTTVSMTIQAVTGTGQSS